MNLWFRNCILLALMVAASGLAFALRPTHRIADQGPKIDLEAMIPRTFGEWREEKQVSAQIVDPQQKEALGRIYTQLLTRTYMNPRGYRVMLSIAYGEDQRDGLEMHYPEICYPAQGFQVLSTKDGVLEFDSALKLPLRQLETTLDQQRDEPITYWTVIGEFQVTGRVAKKLAEMWYGAQGKIPDGLLFRVSSIDPDPTRGFAQQALFIRALYEALTPHSKQRLVGAS